MINSVCLVGRVGKDPEMRYFESGKIKTTFSLAVNRPTKDKETDWFDIELWGRTAEIAGEFVRKGGIVGIEGRLDFSKWEKDGESHCRVIIQGSSMRLIGGKKDSESSGTAAGGQSQYEEREFR